MIKKVVLSSILFLSFSATASANKLYEVQKGDTLTKIAKTHKVSVNDLRAWNKIKLDSIYVKQKIIVKMTSGKASAKPPVAVKPTIPVKTETVVKVPEAKVESITYPLIDEAKLLSEKGQAVYEVLLALGPIMEGIPYLYAGNTVEGFDCSGFIHYMHSQAGLDIVRKSSESYYLESATVAYPIAGDLVFFENTYKEGISHMGIYLGDNEFIHAGTKGVEKAKLDSVYWKEHFVGFKRFHSVSL